MGNGAASAMGTVGGTVVILVDVVHLMATELTPAYGYVQELSRLLRWGLGFVAGLGGFIVIVGSLVLLTENTRRSRSMVTLGAGMGFVSFVFLVLVYSLSGAAAQGQWAIVVIFMPLGLLGVALSCLAQRKAGAAPADAMPSDRE